MRVNLFSFEKKNKKKLDIKKIIPYIYTNDSKNEQ